MEEFRLEEWRSSTTNQIIGRKAILRSLGDFEYCFT
jgi:hypothetical protein